MMERRTVGLLRESEFFLARGWAGVFLRCLWIAAFLLLLGPSSSLAVEASDPLPSVNTQSAVQSLLPAGGLFNIQMGEGGPKQFSVVLQVLMLMTLLSLAPALLRYEVTSSR